MPPHTCPCCGFKSLPEPPGSGGICPICAWQDETDCAIYAADATGPNKTSLIEAQSLFASTSADNRVLYSFGESPPTYERDSDWRPVDLSIDGFERIDTSLGFIGVERKVQSWGARVDQPYYWLW